MQFLHLYTGKSVDRSRVEPKERRDRLIGLLMVGEAADWPVPYTPSILTGNETISQWLHPVKPYTIHHSAPRETVTVPYLPISVYKKC
jgi:hypothetical protein